MRHRFRILATLALPLLLAVSDTPAQPNYYLDAAHPIFKAYAHLPLRLGNGFTAMGGDTLITVRLVGNDAQDSGTLYFLDPVTGEEQFLFNNKDTARFGQEVVIGKGLRSEPIVFKYVNSTDGKAKYTGANAAGLYRFDDNPTLRHMAVNNALMPVSQQLNNLGDHRWAVAGRLSRTEVLFGFEDLMGPRAHDFNDIVFVVTGVQLDTEVKLAAPLITEAERSTSSTRVRLAIPPDSLVAGTRIYYTLDSSAPLFDDNGPVGSSTRLYSAPFELRENTVIRAQAWRPADLDTTAGVTSYLPSAVSTHRVSLARLRPLQAVYLDEDGDGRIDAARISLSEAAPSAPNGLFLEDPFRPGKEISVGRKDFADPAGSAFLLARFRDRPFAFGTGFRARSFGTVPPGAEPYTAGAFTIADSVGPVLVTAEAGPPAGGDAPWLQVTLSEDVAVDPASRDFPFAIRRLRGPDPNGRVKVASVRKVDARTLLYVFEAGSDLYPVPGDSLRLLSHPSITDVGGVRSGMAYHVPARGATGLLRGDIAAMGGDYTVGDPILDPRVVRIPVSVVHVSDVAAGGGIVCLDCRTGEWRAADVNRPATFPNAPRIDITTKGPFSFDVVFFSHLGTFVNRARGVVSDAMLADVPEDAEGNKQVALMWYPVSERGGQVGTGVYIAQGTYRSLDGTGRGGQGEQVRLSSVRNRIGVRFGYVRR